MDFLELMRQRYTAKHYNGQQLLSREDLEVILECARLTPTSTNLQPWHCYVAYGPEQVARLSPALMDFNRERVAGAGALIAVCALNKIDEPRFALVLDKERSDGRYPDESAAHAVDQGRHHFAGLHAGSEQEMLAWTARQAYMVLATMMYAASAMGIDSTPLEGYLPEVADELLDLRAKNLHCLCLLSLGYHAAQDSNLLHLRPKSRLSTCDMFTFL